MDLPKITFRLMTGVASEGKVWHVYVGDYFHGLIHQLQDGWYWGSHDHEAGPFPTPREAARYAWKYLRKL